MNEQPGSLQAIFRGIQQVLFHWLEPLRWQSLAGLVFSGREQEQDIAVREMQRLLEQALWQIHHEGPDTPGRWIQKARLVMELEPHRLWLNQAISRT